MAYVVTLTVYCLLEGLKAAWKAPIAYFLTHTLSADTQRELVHHTLAELTEKGFVVQCLTMDGHASNLSMAKLLGADLSNPRNFKPYFYLPDTQQQVNVLLDPCHMMKLVRNLLHAYKEIKSEDGVVKWSYISRLEELQTESGWRLGNRITKRHINFHQNKMKVIYNFY